MTDVTKIGNVWKATEYGLSNKNEGLYYRWNDSRVNIRIDEDITNAILQVDAEEKARKQKESSLIGKNE